MDFEEAIKAIDETLGIISDLEDNYERIWDRGEDFFVDVRQKLTEVRETIANSGEVSDNQERAIENWGAGIRKWHPDYKD